MFLPMVWLLSVDLRFLSRRTREMDTFTIFVLNSFHRSTDLASLMQRSFQPLFSHG